MQPLVFRGSASRVYAVLTWVVAAVVLAAFAANGGPAEVARYGALPLLLAVIGWTAFWRPYVRIERDGVHVVNVLSTVWLPWATITGTRTRWGLEITTHDRKVGAWALPSRSAVRRWTTIKRDQPVVTSQRRLDEASTGGSDPVAAAEVIDEHSTGHLVDPADAPRAEQRVDVPAAGSLLVATALAAASLLL